MNDSLCSRMRIPGGTVSIATACLFFTLGCLRSLPIAVATPTATTQDSVGVAVRQLAQLVLLIDRYSRSGGELPESISPVVERFTFATSRDPWGIDVRYIRMDRRYELRSAGQDRTFLSEDDIVVMGQLGRNMPCETVYNGQVRRDEFAPACSDEVPRQPLAICPALSSIIVTAGDAQISSNDSVALTGQRAVALARRLDGYARELGGLPRSMLAVTRPDQMRDAWGRTFEYVPRDADFEIRSLGPDGQSGSGDDIWLRTKVGRTIKCSYLAGGENRRCDIPPPECP